MGGDTANLAGDDSDDEDLIGYDAIEPGLPAASSDRHKWWLENGKMPRSSISPPKFEMAHRTALNPKRPINPYTPTEEPDWVNIPRSESRLSSFSSISTSPYEHVNHSTLLSSSASSSTPRKLPPPYDPSALPAKFGRMQIAEEVTDGNNGGPPPPPPPRRQTGMSTDSSMTATTQFPRKPLNKPASAPFPTHNSESVSSVAHQSLVKAKSPPPVAKKPAHLVAPISAGSSVNEGLGSGAVDPGENGDSPPPELPRRSTAGMRSTGSAFEGSPSPQLPSQNGFISGRDEPGGQFPRRAITSAGNERTLVTGPVRLPGMTDRPQPPAQKPVLVGHQKPLAPRPPAPRRSQPVDLLADDAGTDLGGWEALKPT